MGIKPGSRLKSQVDSTEVIVIRAPGGDLQDLALSCGGHPMIDPGVEPASGLTAVGNGDPVQLGKRYSAEQFDGLEVLVTKAGSAGLAVGEVALEVKAAKPLPSSD